MSISSIGSNLQLQNLIQSTMTAADLDKNGQLSQDEFASFFTALLSGLSAKTTAGTTVGSNTALSSSVAAIKTTLATSNAADTSDPNAYAPVPGFDYTKLRNESYVNDKYTPAVRVFSRGLQALGLDAVTSRGNLQPMVDFAKANGFPDAKTVSDDQIDFGDGRGPIDCITSWGTWWFQNQK
jgi:hypothetical protein